MVIKYLLIVLMFSLSFGAFWDIHTVVNMYVDQYIPKKIEVLGFNVAPVVRVTALYGTCVALDNVWGEGNDEAMLQTSLVSLVGIWAMTPKENLDSFYTSAFVAVSHDLSPLKGVMHYAWQTPPVFQFTSAGNHFASSCVWSAYALRISDKGDNTSLLVGKDSVALSHTMGIF